MERIQSALSKAREARNSLQEQPIRPVGPASPVTAIPRQAKAAAKISVAPSVGRQIQGQVDAVQSAIAAAPEALQPWMRQAARAAPVLGALAVGLGLGLWSGLTGVLFLAVVGLVAALALWSLSVMALRVRRLQADAAYLAEELKGLRDQASQEALERAWLIEQAERADERAQAQAAARLSAEQARREAQAAEDAGRRQAEADADAVATPDDGLELQAATVPAFASQRDPRLSVVSADGRTAMAPPARAPADEEQPALALATPVEDEAPALVVADVIRAIQFPESAEDVEGFAALRRVLPDRNMSKLIRATQDVLTLLARDAIYMDELSPDRARPDLWRRFAAGERGRAVAALGGVRDRSCLALTGQKMREDPVFRDAAHHFLRSFDRVVADILPRCADEEVSALADTRTARAFMLVGRVAGTFD
jgi:hypothetical protein